MGKAPDKSKPHWADYRNIDALEAYTLAKSPPKNLHHYFLMKDDGFIFLKRVSENQFGKMAEGAKLAKRARRGEEGRGFKFHLSVHPDDTALAWDAIVEYLQDSGVNRAKIAVRKTLASFSAQSGGANPQQGKIITLYSDEQSEMELGGKRLSWQPIINTVEKKLLQAGVRSGLPVLSDKPVPGSAYSYYRSDLLTNRIDKLFRQTQEKIDAALDADMEGYDRFVDAAAIEKWERRTVNQGEKIATRAAPNFWKDEFFFTEAKAALPGFSEHELLLLKPHLESDEGRDVILRLPPEKRYKLPEELDPFESIQITDTHSLAAIRSKAIRKRGLSPPDVFATRV